MSHGGRIGAIRWTTGGEYGDGDESHSYAKHRQALVVELSWRITLQSLVIVRKIGTF